MNGPYESRNKSDDKVAVAKREPVNGDMPQSEGWQECLDGGTFTLAVYIRLICFYVCRSMRSSIVKLTPENGLFRIFLCSSWAFATRKWRIFNPSFTLKSWSISQLERKKKTRVPHREASILEINKRKWRNNWPRWKGQVRGHFATYSFSSSESFVNQWTTGI